MNAVPSAQSMASIDAAKEEPCAIAEMRGLRLAYSARPVVTNLNWRLMPGQVVGLLGRNGAGKTTLLEALLGLREAQSGTVTLFGQPAAQIDDAARARIGYVPQQSDLFEGFTAVQLLDYFRSFYPRWNQSKVDGLMSRWEIARDKPISRLSGGQQQRLSIIRALAHEPDFLVLDEPVASLDPAGRRDFLRELIDQVLNRGTTVVFSTHILSDLERVAFDLAFLNDGCIALQAPLDELLDQVRAVSAEPAALASIVARHGCQILRKHRLEDGRERWLLLLASGTQIDDALDMQAVNLEDLFMELT